jgi:hypothetical protein
MGEGWGGGEIDRHRFNLSSSPQPPPPGEGELGKLSFYKVCVGHDTIYQQSAFSQGQGLAKVIHARLLSEKYFWVQRMVFQGIKIRRVRLTRHSWCVRRTLRREITFLSADWYHL